MLCWKGKGGEKERGTEWEERRDRGCGEEREEVGEGRMRKWKGTQSWGKEKKMKETEERSCRGTGKEREERWGCVSGKEREEIEDKEWKKLKSKHLVSWGLWSRWKDEGRKKELDGVERKRREARKEWGCGRKWKGKEERRLWGDGMDESKKFLSKGRKEVIGAGKEGARKG